MFSPARSRGRGKSIRSASAAQVYRNEHLFGRTTISSGTLEAAANAAFGTGKVVLNGTTSTILLDNTVNLSNELDINASSFIDVDNWDGATISGALVGTQPFEKDGTGTLILDHDNRATYSGNISYHGTLIAGVTGAFGTGIVTVLGSNLVLADGVTDATSTVLADDLNVFQNGGSATISAAISQSGGPWGLFKEGSGTLVLGGTDIYSGNTIVDAGTLDVEGTLAASFVGVGTGARLAGNGRIGALFVDGGATLAPAASVGTLHVVGNVTFAANSVYQVRISSAASNAVAAEGAAVLDGGVVQVLAAPGPYAPLTTFTLLTAAGGVTGSFAGVTTNLTVLTPTLVDKPGEIDLTLAFAHLASFASSANEAAVANAIEGNFAGALYTHTFAVLPTNEMRQGFDATSGEIHASLRSVLLETGTSLRDAVLDHLHDDAGSDAPSVWAHLFGDWGGLSGDGNAASLDTDFSGSTFGIDTPVADGLRLGAEAGYGQVKGFIAQRGSALTSDSAHLGFYGAYDDGPLRLAVGLAGAWGSARTSRSVRFPSFAESDSAKQATRLAQAFAEAGYDVPLSGVDLEPFVDGGWVQASTGRLCRNRWAQRPVGRARCQRRTLLHPRPTSFHRTASLPRRRYGPRRLAWLDARLS